MGNLKIFWSHRKHLIPITKNYNSHYNLPGPNKLKLWKIIEIAWKFIKIFVNKNLHDVNYQI